MNIEFSEIGGSCPFQAIGIVNGYPLYFRLRFSEWELFVAKTGCDPIYPPKDECLLQLGADWDCDGFTGDADIDEVKNFIISLIEDNMHLIGVGNE